MYRIYFKASIYIVVASVMMVAIASIVIINLGERVSNVLSSTTAMASSWHTICLVINGVEAKLYLADTSSKQTEGYMFKSSTDFLGIGAVGMLFNISTQPGYSVAFTMKNVAFPLYLLHITHVEGVGDVAVDIIYMEPADLLSRLQVIILVVIPFRRIIGSPHLFGFTSVIWEAVGVVRDPPGAHHPGLHKN
jgi:uncharacterized membrane protein (UPF0127 family)